MAWIRIGLACICLGFGVPALAAGPRPATPPEAEFFEKHVRPVLVEHCTSCHGPKRQQAGLRLDSAAHLARGSDSGPVVLPGNSEGSPLVQAIRHQGDVKMPPKGKLPAPAVDALTAWVRMGAPWPGGEAARSGTDAAATSHWAFQPVRKPPLPAVRDTTWPRTPVDHFILAQLEQHGLRPAPPADKRTLLRRVTFDLIGLPPTPEEVAAFEADSSAEAFARVVDRLLASPHYGERWGRHWLDVARYADTKGYVFFEEKEYPWAWTYRDYVIRAFNQDLPYDRFLLEQLAADRLELGSDRRPLAALGFLTLGGRFMNNPHDILDDRIDVVTRGLLGLTVGCARCHDHKFDPIPSRDYYALYGVFASCFEPTVPPLFEPPPATEAYAKFAREMHERQQRLAEYVRAQYAAVVQGARTRVAEYLLAAHALRGQPSTDDFMLLADGSDLNPAMIQRWKAYLDRTERSRHPVFLPWHAFAALPEEQFAARAASVCAQLATPGTAAPVNPLVARLFVGMPPASLREVAERYARLLNAADQREEGDSPWGEAVRELRQVFRGPDAPPVWPLSTVNDLVLFPDRPGQARLQELRKAVEQWRDGGPAAPPRALVLEDAEVPYEPRVFLRGNPSTPGEAVPRRFLSVLAPDAPPFREGSGRLELARAIASKDNPLTARVLVNRVWLHHFGTGLVRTPGDFGLRSDPPTHPELLDYLAATFMEDGWSIKRLHRRLLLSAVYQQRSDDRPECRPVDPENRLLGRMNRRRLDFEATRDGLLAVAGRLDRTVGGPSARDLLASPRRTLYGHLDRLNVPGLLRTFDFPSPDATSPRRDTTTVAPQALFLMNSPFVLDCARRLVQRPGIAEATDVPTRLDRLYRILFGRPPSTEEVGWAAVYLASAGAPGVAWERLAHALLLTNEWVFLD